MVVLFDIYQFKAYARWLEKKTNKQTKNKNKNKKQKQKIKQNKTKTEEKKEKEEEEKNKTKQRPFPRRSTDLLLTALFSTPTTPSFKMVAVEMASCTVFPPGP